MAKMLKIGVAVAVALMFSSAASATTLDLTTAGAFGSRDGAIFIQGPFGSGTGVFPSFVQVGGNNPVHSAYNTTANNVLDNGSSPTFNHEITLSQVPTVTLAGHSYYVFLLDINEVGNDTDKYLSLDSIMLVTSTTPNQSLTTPSLLGTVRFNLSAGNNIGLNFGLEPGSGQADMAMLIPTGDFGLAPGSSFVYLFSSFGALGTTPGPGLPAGNYGASDGFEEWALSPDIPQVTQFCTTNPTAPDCQNLPDTPEPATLALLGTGLAVMAYGLRKRAVKS